MKEAYIEYWGLERHPFLMAPDSHMMYVTGQYYECLERLKYAVNTHKGGVLIVSEDAGLGKTTILLKLIEELHQQYGEAFKHALVDHPTLDPSQMISYITAAISGYTPHDDKLKNILMLKESLIDIKRMGGKAIIIVDEGQMLCGAHDVLQELRVLINLSHENEYLHTLIFSGQRPLWEEIKRLPEFWQRLPVRYYFVPLRLDETREMIRFRLKRAGINSERRIFSDDALEMIHKSAKGSPRTIIALADLALLIGYTDRAGMIGFKEITKALNVMSGRGEGLPYITYERDHKKPSAQGTGRSTKTDNTKDIKETSTGYSSSAFKREPDYRIARPFFIILFCISLLLVGAVGYHYFFGSQKNKDIPVNRVETAAPKKAPDIQEETQDRPLAQEIIKVEDRPEFRKKLVVTKGRANIRSAPDIFSPRVGVIFKGESLKIIEEKKDEKGDIWYKIPLYGDKEGWISDSVVRVSEW